TAPAIDVIVAPVTVIVPTAPNTGSDTPKATPAAAPLATVTSALTKDIEVLLVQKSNQLLVFDK
ncbi:hypothetical protein, partial [Vibrio parahaemolyticus]|uniref:hypothetical protein n=1 Tax=Vibrio parahaemolyticus TaxID=670 RepID=UPI0017936BC9